MNDLESKDPVSSRAGHSNGEWWQALRRVLGKVLDNILESVRRSPRPCAIVYANAVHAEEMAVRNMQPLSWPAKDFTIYMIDGSA